MDKIELSDQISVKNSFLPELILCEPDQVFRKRSKPKILKHPEYNPDSIEFKYWKSVLDFFMLGGFN